MEQGVAAPLGKVHLYSGQFSTCSPIVMFNRATTVGGLYHFPGGGTREHKEVLQAMCNHIRPTHIFIFRGNTGPFRKVEKSQADPQRLESFFRKVSPQSQITHGAKRSLITITLSEGNGLDMSNSQPDQIKADLRNAKNVELPEGCKLFGAQEVADHWM
jgi:hypothetical protein